MKYAGSYGSAPNSVSVCGPPLKKAISMALLSAFGTSPGASGEQELYVIFETGGEQLFQKTSSVVGTPHHARLRISPQESGDDLIPIRSLISCALAVRCLTRSLTPVSSLSLPAVWCEIRVFYKYITTFTRLSVPSSEERMWIRSVTI